MIQECRGHHQPYTHTHTHTLASTHQQKYTVFTWIDGSPNNSPQGVPRPVIKPVVEAVKTFIGQELGSPEIEVAIIENIQH